MFSHWFRHVPPEPEGDPPTDPLAPSDDSPGEDGHVSRAEIGRDAPGADGYEALLGGLEVDLLGGSDSDEDA